MDSKLRRVEKSNLAEKQFFLGRFVSAAAIFNIVLVK